MCRLQFMLTFSKLKGFRTSLFTAIRIKLTKHDLIVFRNINIMTNSESNMNFNFQKAIVFAKMTRYEFEKVRHSSLTEKELKTLLSESGANYDDILKHHEVHKQNESVVVNSLKELGIEVKVINRLSSDYEEFNWADIVFATGGDGTYLLASSRIKNRNIPLIGINTDPSKSEGYLCLPKKYTYQVSDILLKIKKGDFRWLFRQRIRITLVGTHLHEAPLELHSQYLPLPEHRYFEFLSEEVNRRPGAPQQHCQLPVLALNEVFMGENLSARVSYLEIQIDKQSKFKKKCSGFIVSTGTGTTSWTFNVNKLTHQCVANLMDIISQETNCTLDPNNVELVNSITNRFNQSLVLNPESPFLVYTIRDSISTGTHPNADEIPPRGMAQYIEVRSRCQDAWLVVDGGMSFHFNDGSIAVLEIHEEDALRTIIIDD